MSPRLRYSLIALSLLLAILSIADYRAWAGEQLRLGELLDRAQIEETFPGLGERVRRANSPLKARLRATRPLVAHYLNPAWLFDIEEDERAAAWERSVETLEEIRALAADTMARQPTSWQAPMLFGATTYLLQPHGNLAVSMSDLGSWELPLNRAQALTPQHLEPARYLTVAYVQHWQSLTAVQRREASKTLKRAFEDPTTFNLVIELWLRLVPDRREAMALVPDEPFAWQRLERIFQRRGEWSRHREAHQRYLLAHQRQLEGELEEAAARVAGGDYRTGTSLYHSVAAKLSPDSRNLQLMKHILARMPAGPVAAGASTNFRAWLEWALQLGFLRQSPFDGEELRRLIGNVQDIKLHEEATARLLAGDLAEAMRIEKRRQGTFDSRWGPYLVLKAEALLDRSEIDDARLALLRATHVWEQHPTYLRVQMGIAEARNDVQTIAVVEQALDRLPTSEWRGTQMTWSRSRASLELVADRSSSGLDVSFLELPPQGRLIEALWNGGSLGTFVAYPDQPLELEMEIDRQPSLLELRAADSRPFVPGAIKLR